MGGKLLGYDSANNQWIPILIDATGKLQVSDPPPEPEPKER